MRTRGLVADLVIVNEQASSYVQDLQQAIEQLCENSRSRGKELGPRQHIFAVRRDLMDENSYKTLLAVARVVLHTRNGRIFRPDRARRGRRPLAARDAARLAEGETAERRRRRQDPAPPSCLSPARRDDARSTAKGCGRGTASAASTRAGRDYVVQARPRPVDAASVDQRHL